MPRWTAAATAAATAALLAAGVVGAVTVRPDDARPAVPASSAITSVPATPSSSTSAPATPSIPSTSGGAAAPSTEGAGGNIETVVPAIEAFVEQARGLRFKTAVTVTLLGDREFEERVTETDTEETEEVEHAEAVLRAMGLIDDGVDLAAVVRSLTAGAALGFYDPHTKELVVRGTRPSPFVRSVLAHELAHALEDQHFNLDRDHLGDEAFLGFEALAEGSAVRIEERYRRSLSPADRRAADREEQSQGGSVPDVPEVVQVIFGFPYAYGPDLVAAILKAGGQGRLDRAFVDPPASSEQVLDPDRYLDGDKPVPVPVPAADGTAFDDGEIGQLFLALMLRSGLADDTARTAADGWGGDHYVAWKEGARTCVRMDFVMDTAADTAELTAALAGWTATRKGAATATATSLRTCG